MPVVPTYEDRGIRLDPGLNFRDSTKATGEMFGSQVGEAMGKAGQGLVDVGKAVAEVHELDATNTAKDSSNTTLGGFREATFGKNGYMNTTGRAAVEGLDAYRNTLLQLAQDGAKGLSPLAARKYWDATNVSINSLMDEAAKHAMQERKTWSVGTSKARVDTFRENAAASWDNNDEKLDMIAAVTEYQHLGNLLDWNKDDLAGQSAALISGVHEDRIRRKAETDPMGAQADIETNKGFLLPGARDRLKDTVGKAADDERTLQGAMAFAAGPRKSAEVPQRNPDGEAGANATGQAGSAVMRDLMLGRLTGDDAGKVLRADPNFVTNLSALMEDAPPKYRDDINVDFPKSGADGAGRSATLTYKGKSFSMAPADLMDWARRNAGRYGMLMPVGGEQDGSVMAGIDGVAARALRPSAEAIDKHLETITDPGRRDIARLAIMTTLAQQSQQEQQQQQAAKAELWRQVDAGAVPDTLPYTVRQTAGSSAMTVARNYVSKAQDGPIISDDVLLRDMRLYAAERPEDFAQVDLNDYRDRLEKSDLKALSQTQSAIGQDSRKARDAGAELASAFDMARTRLENAGALTPGEESADQRQLLARVQNTVYSGLAEFRAANPGAKPTPSDIRKMVDPFLLPYYLPQPDPRRGKPAVKLSDISPDLRTSITRQLAMEFGRKPTDGEVAREYAAFRQSQPA